MGRLPVLLATCAALVAGRAAAPAGPDPTPGPAVVAELLVPGGGAAGRR